jgi:hypothetical protein
MSIGEVMTRRRLRSQLLIVLMMAGASGCGSVKGGSFDSFSASVNKLAGSTESSFRRVGHLQDTYMSVRPAAGKLTANSFDPVVVNNGKTESFDLTPDLEVRIAGLEVLKQYADTLRAFAENDYQNEVDSSAQALGASANNVKALPTASASTKEASGQIASAVSGLGNAYLEYEKIKALNSVMLDAQPKILALANELIRVNDEIRAQFIIEEAGTLNALNDIRWYEPSLPVLRSNSLLAETALNRASAKSSQRANGAKQPGVASAVLQAAADEINREKKNGESPAPSLARLEIDQIAASIVSEFRDANSALDAEDSALRSLPKAHEELRASLYEDSNLAELKTLIAATARLAKLQNAANN